MQKQDIPSKGEKTSFDQLDQPNVPGQLEEADRSDLASLVAECELALSEGFDEFELVYPMKKPEKEVTFFGIKCPVIEFNKNGFAVLSVNSQALRDKIMELYPQLTRMDISMALEDLKKQEG